MKYLITAILVSISLLLNAQSKKELEAKVKALQSEIEQLKKPKEMDLNDPHKKAGYGMGVLIGTNIKNQGGDSLDVEAIAAAIKDVFTNKTPAMDQQQCMTVVQQYMQQAMDLKTAKVREEGMLFLENNKKNAGITTTASGLQYKIVTTGAGKSPGPNDNVTVHYTGTLTNGAVFDSSVQRGQPASFYLNQVISGWTEALQLMKEGDKWILYIPSDLGYGARGSGQIPPHATLIFEVELIKVN